MLASSRGFARSVVFILGLGLLALVAGPVFAQPTFEALSPADGALLDAGEGTLTGRAVGAASLTIDGVAVALDGSGNFSWPFDLDEGESLVQLRATDSGGAVTEQIHTLVVDTSAPQFSITTPASPRVASSPVTVSGSIGEPHLDSITVGGVTASVDAGSFSAAVPLVEGAQTIQVRAVDVLGHVSSVDLVLTLDTAAPTIAITEAGQPFAGGLFRRAVVPEVTITDASTLVSTLTLDGQPWTSGTAISTEGAHVLRAEATDAVGWSTEVTVSFTLDTTPPSIGTITPASGTVLAAAPSLVVAAPGASLVRVQSSSGGSVEATGTSPFTVGPVPLVEGENDLLVEAFDEAGNRVERAHRLVLDTTAPTLAIEAPSPGDVLAAGPVRVAGSAPDPRLLEVRVTSPAGSWLANLVGETFAVEEVALVEGSNAITVTAKDSLGNESTASVTVTLDTAAPTFQVLVGGAPLVSGTTFADAITPTIQVDDPAATLVATLDGASFTSGTLVDTDGVHELQVTVTNTAGTSSSALYVFTIDRQTPVLEILSPSAGTVLADAEVTLHGQAAGAVEVLVDGQPANLHAGDFTAGPFALVEGPRDFQVVARGRNALEATETLRVVRDATPPTLRVDSPADGALVGEGSVDVAGTVTDPHLERVTVSGVEATVSGSTFLARRVPIAEGETTLVARAEDAAGHVTEVSREVVRDATAPTIALTDPEDGAIFPDASITVRGTVDDAHLDRVEVSGVRATVAADGTWSAEVALAEGANVLRVTAVDRLGLRAETSRTVHRDSNAPSVRIVVPSEGSSANATSLEVRGTVDDEAGTEVRVNGQVAIVDQGSWRATITLQPGDNRLVARATDAQGNEGVHTRTVVLDQDAPVFLAADPAAGALAVGLASNLRATFSEPLAAPESDDWSLTADGQVVVADASVEGEDLVIDPAADLPSASSLVLTLGASLTDRAGNALGEAVTLQYTTADTSAPGAPSLDAVPAAFVCAPSLLLEGTAEAASLVSVSGGASATKVRAGADGRFRLDIALLPDRFHRLEIVATDADGFASSPLVVEVTQDCRPPAVVEATLVGDQLTVTFDEPVTSASVDAALAVTDDQGAVGRTATVVGAPPAEVAAYVLDRVPVGATVLDVSTAVRDRAGNPLAFPYRRLFGAAGGESFLAGTVIDDATGRPLAGAVVRVTATDGVALVEPLPQQTTGPDGRFLLSVPAGTHRVLVDRPGHTPVFRVATTSTGEGTQVFDPRPTPAAPATTLGSAGGTLEGRSAIDDGDAPTLVVPASALASVTSLALTGLDEQGLPALLPYGWSPRGGAWLDLGADLLAPATLSLPVEAPNGTVLDAVTLDLDTLQWRVVAQPTVTGGVVEIPVDGLGAWLAVEADFGATAPPAALVGEVLGSASAPLGDEVSAASLGFDPEIVLPTQRSRTTVSYTLDAAVPSGYPLTLSIEETLERLDGSIRRQAPYRADLVLYRSPSGTPRSRFFLEPSDAARAEPLKMGSAQVDVLQYGDETVRGDVLGPEGGAVVNDDGDRLDVPAGALVDPTAIALVRRTAADLPLAAPRGASVVGVLEIDLGAGDTRLRAAADLFFAVDPAPAAGSVGLLLHVDEVDGAAVYRAVAALEPAPGPTVTGWSTATIDPVDLAWPGVRDGGLYALVELTVPHGYLRGTARATDGTPLAGAVVESPSVDWIQRSNADGTYVLPLPVAVDPLTVTVVDPVSGDQVSVAVTVDTDGGRVDLDPTVQVTGPWVVEITPADEAVGVPVAFEPLVRFSEPVDRASLADAITLTSDGASVEIDLDHQGDRVTLQPRATLLPDTTYTLRVGLGVRDLTGHPLQSSVTTTFTTQVDPTTGNRLDRDKVRLFAPDDNGLARIVGLPGAAPAETLVYVENVTSFTSTESVTSGLDGSFEITISASLDDRLVLHVLIEGSSEDLLVLGPFLSADERSAYIPRTGDHRFLTIDGLVVTIDEGTFPAPTWVRLEPRDAESDPIATDPDFETAARFRLDLGGQTASKPILVRVPMPAGLDLAGDPELLLLRHVEAVYRGGWMVDDLLRVDAGAFTNEPTPKATAKAATKNDAETIGTTSFETPRNARVLSLDDAALLAADPNAVLPFDPSDIEPAGPVDLPPPWEPLSRIVAREKAAAEGGTAADYAVGVLSSGDYQVAVARIPLAWLIVPAIYPDLVAFNRVFEPPMASLLDAHRFALGHRHFLLPTPAAGASAARTPGAAATKAGSGFDVQVLDTATGYELFHESGDAPDGEQVTLAPDAYQDTAPPLPLDASPFGLFLVQTPPVGQERTVAPGITASFDGTALAVSGDPGSAAAEVAVRLAHLDGTAQKSAETAADGSFDVQLEGVAPGVPVLLATGARLAGADEIRITWSESLDRASVDAGLQVLPFENGRVVEKPIAIEHRVPGTGEVVHSRPPTGWRAGDYVLRIGPALSDIKGNPWPMTLDIPFVIAESSNLGSFSLARFADVARFGQLLFVAASEDGLKIIDTSHPRQPRHWLGSDRGFLFPGGVVVRGVDVDLHGRVWAVGGGEAGFGQLKALDPVSIDLASVDSSDPASVDAALASAFRGSILLSDPVNPGTETFLENGLPRRVVAAGKDDVTRFTWGVDPVPASLNVTSAPSGGEPGEVVLTVSGTLDLADERVSLRNLDRGRFVHQDATGGSFSLQVEALPGETIDLRRARDSQAYVTIDGVGLARVLYDDFWGQDIATAGNSAPKVHVASSLGLAGRACGSAPVQTEVPIDVDVLRDGDDDYTVVALVPNFGLALVGPSFAGRGAACGELLASGGGGDVTLVDMVLAENYPLDRNGDGVFDAEEREKDYVAVSHRRGYVIVFDVTNRSAPERVAEIPLAERGTEVGVGGLALDRVARRLYVAGFGKGVYVVDFDRLHSVQVGDGLGVSPFIDRDGDDWDDRLLETITVTGESVTDIQLVPELGLLWAGGRDIGLTAFLTAPPALDVLAVDDAYERRVGAVAPFGVPTAPEAEDFPNRPGAVRVMAHLPGLATTDQQAANDGAPTIRVDLVGQTPSGGPIDGPDREARPELPPAALAGDEALELHRLAANPWEDGYRRYRSRPVALLADLRASIAYERTSAEDAVCQRCDQVAEGLYESVPSTPAGRLREMLSGHTVAARLSTSMGAALDGFFENQPRPEVILESVPWDLVPALNQEPNQSASFGTGDVAPGTLLHSGEATHAAVDLTLPGLGIDFVFARTYRSQTVGEGPLGPGWDHGYRIRLRPLPNGAVELFDGRGRRELFTSRGENVPTFEAPPGRFASLRRHASGYTLADASGSVVRFDAWGRLVSIVDASKIEETEGIGTEMTFHYDAFSRLERVSSVGRDLTLYYDEKGKLERLEDDTGRDVLYDYVGGKLVGVQSPEVRLAHDDAEPQRLKTTYAYEEPTTGTFTETLHRADDLVSITNAKDETWLELDYVDLGVNNSRGSILEGQTWGGDPLTIAVSPTETKVTDRRGYERIYKHTTQGHLQRLQEPTPTDEQGNPVGEPPVTLWEYGAYDGREDGLVTKVTLPDGQVIETTYAGRKSAVDGSAEHYTAPTLGNIAKIEHRPGAGNTLGEDDPDAAPECTIADVSTNGSPSVMAWTYGDHHWKTQVPRTYETPSGLKRTVDIAGNFTETGVPEGFELEVPGLDGPAQQTIPVATPRDARGRKKSRQLELADGRTAVRSFEYLDSPASSLPQKIQVQTDDPSGPFETSFTYDRGSHLPRGHLTEMEEPGGVITTRNVNALGWPLEECRNAPGYAENELCVRTTYDSLGQVLEVDRPSGPTGSERRKTTYIYGSLGELKKVEADVDANRRISEIRTYDKNRNLESVDATGTGSVQLFYDERNLLVRREEGLLGSTVTTYQYDSMGREKSRTDPRGHAWKQQYDGYGRLMASVDPEENRTLVSYDDGGRAYSQRVCSTNGELLAETLSFYDGLDRLVKSVAINEEIVENANGDPVATKVELPTVYSYDRASNLESVQDPRGTTTTYSYDRALRRTGMEVATLGSTLYREDYGLDERGRLVTSTRVHPDHPTAASVTTTLGYDALDRVRSIVDPLGHETTRAYDAAGRVIREIDPEGHPTSWRYDALGRILEVTRPQGITVAYEYQDDLDTTTVTYRDALDQETISFYDELGRLVSTTYPDGTMEQMELDANGNAEVIEQANGTVWTQTFDPLNRLATRAIAPASGVPAPSVETYDFDALGRLANIVRGGIGTQIDYDLLSRPVAETTLGRTVARDYDAIGNPESLGYPSSLALARTFTNLSQLDTITANGSPLADLDWAGQLPRSKQILSGASGTATTTWLYDEAERLVGHGTTWGTSGNAKSLVDERLRLDDRGLRVASIREDLGDQGWSYGLDGAGRLTSAQRAVFDAADQPIAESRPQTSSLSSRIEYGYDTAQNLESRRVTGLCGAVEETTMPPDSSGRNRPGAIGEVTLEWDDNGNLTRRGGQTFTYDDRDRLVEVRDGGSLIANYTYDAFDRRIRKTVGGRTFETVWDGWQAIEEIETFQDDSELLQSRRVYGTGIDEVLRLELRQGNELKSYTPIYDATTSLVALADDTGRIVERYEYTPYGERIVRTDLIAPSVEQVRLETGVLVVELSEVVAGDGLESAVLENVTKGTVVPVEWDRPVVEGRRALHRLVIEPQSPDPENPTVEPGDTLRWTLPASALRDAFGNEASLDYVSPTFAWSESTAAIIEDTAVPEILEACVVDRKLRLGFSEPIDAATFSELQVAGVTAWQATADGYGLESATTLDVGDYTLTIGAVADLAGQPIASPSSLPVEVKTTPTSVFAAPFEGEQITSTVGNTLGFQGLPLDEETGFYYVRHRYYDPSMGRFTQPDPLEYVDGPSMYAFAAYSPASYLDPMGLSSFFFDGTWNYSYKEFVGSGETATNVWKLWQVSLDPNRRYYGGIGNKYENSWLVEKLGGGTGYGGKEILDRAFNDLTSIVNTTDDRTVDIYGFSRGGALSLEFANMISDGVPELDEEGNRTGRLIEVDIRFMGLFDVVGSFGVPGDMSNPGYRLRLPQEDEIRAVHLVALHETRSSFPVSDVVGAIQVGLPGVHSNTGGSYKNTSLSNVALQLMLQSARKAGAEFGGNYDQAVGNPNTCPNYNNKPHFNNSRRKFPRGLVVPFPEAFDWILKNCSGENDTSQFWPRSMADVTRWPL